MPTIHSAERALLVRLTLASRGRGHRESGGDTEAASSQADEISEFEALAQSAGVEVVGFIRGSRQSPDPRLFVGSGKAEEIRGEAARLGATVVLFDHPLSPSQERNLESVVKCRVLDRTGLILDIFAQRARTFEGKLQVELAQLKHLATRLVRGWTHLERQKGGIGLRGPGETQLETDRRRVQDRIARIQREMDGVRRDMAFEGTLRQFFDYIRTDPRFHPRTAQELAEGFAAVARQVDAHVPRFFLKIPRTPLVIQPYPEFRAKYEAGASYNQGSADGSRPAMRPRACLTALPSPKSGSASRVRITLARSSA